LFNNAKEIIKQINENETRRTCANSNVFFKCCHLEANIDQFVASKSVENSSTNEEQFFVINN
jgi:hypothetical protein